MSSAVCPSSYRHTNEATTLAGVVKKLLELPHLLEVVIVDDCSRDQTPEIAASLAARAFAGESSAT
jgi:hypothetical protein